jgi:L-2-hydroxyglutarate oxidase LhgO
MATTERIEMVVAGAGVVGLAVARALAQAGREVLVLEAESSIGTITSSRSSEVIHAGLYYPRDSLKARLCVEGRDRLYHYCAGRGVAARRLGKLVVATAGHELDTLNAITGRAEANGVFDLAWLDGAEAKRLEPALACVGALLSPSTGIVDSHGLMLAYQGDAEAAGAQIVCRAPVVGGEIAAGGLSLAIGGDPTMRLDCRWLINCAGLDAVALAGRIAGLPSAALPRAYFCKGSYYTLTGRAPFSRLIYPVPEHAGLGVHLTLDLGGQARFGPDIEWVDRPGYDVEIARAAGFYAAIRKYWPALPDGALQPGYAGIRPKIGGPHEPTPDFRIDGPRQHGVMGLINLFGIESPGLTASLAIARHVAELVAEAESS